MKITAEWFKERGGLHDARVLDAKVEATTVHIRINDEWANEQEPGDQPSPGTLVFDVADILAGDLATLAGGWLSEARYQGSEVVFDFCDRDRVVIKAQAAVWEPDRAS